MGGLAGRPAAGVALVLVVIDPRGNLGTAVLVLVPAAALLYGTALVRRWLGRE